MNLINKKNFLFEDVSTINGVGKKLSLYLKKKKIEKVNDLLWNLPYSFTDRSQIVTLDKLEIGKIFTIKVKILKYNFPKASIFLGDSGSYFLGAFIAISVINTSTANPTISPFYFCILFETYLLTFI